MEAVIAAVCGSALAYTLARLLLASSGKERVRERISRLFPREDIDTVFSQVIAESRKKRKTKPARFLTEADKTFGRYLAQSGVHLKSREFLSIWAAAALVPGLFLFLLDLSPISIAAAVIVGLAVPPALVKRARKKREQLFSRQLGEALILIGNCIRSGYSFQQAMESIARDLQPPISTEFARALRETQLGVKLEDALHRMVERARNRDLDLLVRAVITSTQVGGNLSEILDTISATIRDRIKIKDDIRILTSSGRISGLIIGLLPAVISLFLMLVNPAYIQSFWSNPLGKIMIAAAFLLELIGFAAVNKIVDIKY